MSRLSEVNVCVGKKKITGHIAVVQSHFIAVYKGTLVTVNYQQIARYKNTTSNNNYNGNGTSLRGRSQL